MIFVYEFSLPIDSMMSVNHQGRYDWFYAQDRRNRNEFQVSIPGEIGEHAPLFDVPKHTTFSTKVRRSIKGVKMLFDDPLLGTTQVYHRLLSPRKVIEKRKKDLELLRTTYKDRGYASIGSIYQSNLCQEIPLQAGEYTLSQGIDLPSGVHLRGGDYDGDVGAFVDRQAMIQLLAAQRAGRTEQMRRVTEQAAHGERLHQAFYATLRDTMAATSQESRRTIAWDFSDDLLQQLTSDSRDMRSLYYTRSNPARPRRVSFDVDSGILTETTSNHPVTDQRNPPRRQHGPRNRNQHW